MRYASIAVATVVLTTLSMMPAIAATSADTTVTFTVEATDGLNITAPASAALSDTTPGGDASGSLGVVTVTDERSAINASWTVTAELASSFTTGTQTPAETIYGSNVDYAPGPAINPVNGPFVPGGTGPLFAPRTAFSRSLAAGNNSVSWNPTLTVHVPAAAVAGDYTGVVRHSVA
ncbi:hypothetical protein [Streptomyces sp. MS2.AVA.5]|uniref:Uncharacterized protein n=1 Tax=Streptomyces achmelvichensis TaxID=3134111 RepID=A0ACC6PMG4_9ACTN